MIILCWFYSYQCFNSYLFQVRNFVKEKFYFIIYLNTQFKLLEQIIYEYEVKNVIYLLQISQYQISKIQYYQCLECHYPLFKIEDVYLPHQFHKATSQNGACFIFLKNKQEWMNNFLIGNNKGQILCPKCNQKLGSFNWSGQKCPCGKFVVPYIGFNRNKILFCEE